MREIRLPWHGGLLAGLLAAASLSAEAMGTAWAWFAVFGLWQAWRLRQQPGHTVEYAPHLHLWLIACLGAFIAKAVATLYWHDPWKDRHGEIRLLLGAIAVYGA